MDIIGVVSDARTADLTHGAEPEVYFSLWQNSAFSKDLIVRTASDPRSVAAAVLRELRGVDPTVAVENLKTLEQVRDDSLASAADLTCPLRGSPEQPHRCLQSIRRRRRRSSVRRRPPDLPRS